MHPFLEHAHRATHAICRYGITSVQFGLVQAFVGVGKLKINTKKKSLIHKITLLIPLFYFTLQVSTHGYSQNQILIWKYPSLAQVAQLTGHSYRVLYLAMSPDGESIVTGAGDETLRFWSVFNKTRSQKVKINFCALNVIH
jgi:cell division cycle 20-like protein 1 (cofactor of APC complex)